MADVTRKSIDIAKPGTVAPDTTARPIITGHKTIQDPMVKNDTATETQDTKASAPVQSKKKVISPIVNKTEEPRSEPDVDVDNSPTDDNQPSTSESAVVGAVIDQLATKKENSIDAEEVKKIEEIEKHISEKTFFVPIGTPKQEKADRAVVVVLILILITGVGVLLAADAGLITAFESPFNFL